MEKIEITRSIFFFILAGLCEIGGGYLVWLWLREEKGIWLGLLGAIVLIIYGVIPTFQPANFGRVYAAYGGVFVVLSILWGWQIELAKGIILIGRVWHRQIMSLYVLNRDRLSVLFFPYTEHNEQQ